MLLSIAAVIDGGNAGYQLPRGNALLIYRGNDGGAAAYWRRRQCRLSIAVIFSIARRAVRTARFLSRRQCRYQSIRRAIFSIRQ